jgi:hypothetical protein
MVSPQRLKGKLESTIAEEQARQKALAAQREKETAAGASGRPDSVTRSASTRAATSPAGRPRPDKKSQDMSNVSTPDAAVSPDPAIFEEAYKNAGNGDLVPPPNSVVGTPGDKNGGSSPHPDTEKDTVGTKASEDSDATQSDVPHTNDTNPASSREPGKKPDQPEGAASAVVPPEVQTKLNRLAKLEKSYKGMFIHEQAFSL